MSQGRALEQHIAVFGESGSGKTVLLSSFYGAAQESQNITRSGFNVLAENPTQGTQLDQNYLGMKKSGKLPEPNRFSSTSYSFLIKLKVRPRGPVGKPKLFDALRLVWHDYPGEWFEQDVSGLEEAQRRVDTFRSLLSSDVALLLVDAQRLIDNSGSEERYLKSLMTDYRNQLLLLEEHLLVDGKPLAKFPRIWMMALSKSDLLPEMTASDFKELLVEKVGGEINELRDVLSLLVASNMAMSVGEDFVLLSSAKFGVDKIEVGQRVGLDLILPVAAVLPFERHVRWAKAMHNRGKVAEGLLSGASALAIAMGGAGAIAEKFLLSKSRLLGGIGQLVNVFGSQLSDLAKSGSYGFKALNAEALAKHDYLTATLTGFQIDLDRAEEEKILIKSPR